MAFVFTCKFQIETQDSNLISGALLRMLVWKVAEASSGSQSRFFPKNATEPEKENHDSNQEIGIIGNQTPDHGENHDEAIG